MRDLNTNIDVVKSKSFAVRCVKLRKYLIEEMHEYDMSRQLLRSGQASERM